MEIVMLIAFSLPVIVAIALGIPKESAPQRPMGKQLIVTGFHMLLIAGSFVVGLAMVGVAFAYGKSVENDSYRYSEYLTTIASYSYLETHRPQTPCLDRTHFKQELLKRYPGINGCQLADVSTRFSWLDLVFFRGPEMTLSFRADFKHANNFVALDLDRRCEVLKKIGITVQELIQSWSEDDCRPGAFQVLQNGPHLVVRVRRKPFRF